MKKLLLLYFAIGFANCLFCQSNPSKNIKTDTTYYNSEFNFYFPGAFKKDSLKFQIKCSKEYIYVFPANNNGEFLLKEYYENGFPKSKGILKAVGPYDKKMTDAAFLHEPIYDKAGQIIDYKDKTEYTSRITKLYYIEKYADWLYYDESNNVVKTTKHTLPNFPKSLVNKRYEEYCKKCSEFSKKYPNEKNDKSFVRFE